MRRFLFGALALSLVLGMGGIAWADEVKLDAMQDYYMYHGGMFRQVGSGGLFIYDFSDVKYPATAPAVDPGVPTGAEWGLNAATYKGKNFGYDDSALFSSNGNVNFLSLCLETSELVPSQQDQIDHDFTGKLNRVTYRGDNSFAVTGGAGLELDENDGSLLGDPICQATAWLYYQFATGQLPGFDRDYHVAGVFVDVRDLQNAVWYLEQEIASAGNGARYLDSYITAYNAAYGAGSIGAGDYAALRGAWYDMSDSSDFTELMMRLSGGDLGLKPNGDPVTRDHFVYAVNTSLRSTVELTQDCLFMTAETDSGIVPEPTTLLIWGLGLSLFGLVRRR